MIIMVISSLEFSAALEFSFTSPDEIEAETEFEVQILAEASETYDVKIYVFDDAQQYCEIYDGTAWRGPYRYISESFPSQTTYRLISHYIGETEICVQLRKTGGSNFDKLCKPITISGSSGGNNNQNNQTNETSGNNNQENDEGQNNQEINNQENMQENIQQEPIQLSDNNEQVNNERIVLNSPKESEDASFMTDEQKFRVWILYGFTFLCLVIIILLALRRL